MKKTIITLLALAGVAGADTVVSTLDATLDGIRGTYGAVAGGDNTDDDKFNTAIEASKVLTSSTTYAEFMSELELENTWYITKNFNSGVYGDGYASDPEAVTIVLGGPSGTQPTLAAIRFTIKSEDILNCTGPLTLSFDVKTAHGNDKKNHAVTFYLLNEITKVSSLTYNTQGSSNTLLSDNPTNVRITLSDEQVNELKATNKDYDFIFMAEADDTTGSNRGIKLNNFKLTTVPEPTTATLSLLALCGLAARRRRK